MPDRVEPPFKHDNYILYVMQFPQVYRPFFQNFLPAKIRNLIDFDKLELIPQTLTNTDLQRKYMDLAYGAPFKGYPEDHLKFHIIFEHKSNTQDFHPIRMLRYKVELMERYYDGTPHCKLPPVFPIVFYHGKQPYTGPKNLSEAIQAPEEIKPILIENMEVFDTFFFNDQDLVKLGTHLGIATLVAKHIFDEDFELLVDGLTPLIEKLEDSGFDLDFLNATIKYIIKDGQAVKAKETLALFQKVMTGKKGEMIMTIADYLREEGKKEGRQEIFEAIDLVQKGLDLNVVAKEMDLSPEQVRQLAAITKTT